MFIPKVKKKRFREIPTDRVGIFVKDWNIKYPLDRWFREKYKIPWNSEEHRKVTLISIFFEFNEDSAYRKVLNQMLGEEKEKEDDYRPGNWWRSGEKDIEIEQSEDLFDKIDTDSIQEDEEGNIILEL